MKKVIDSNFFSNAALKNFLSTSKDNYAVLCEFSGLEAYKASDPIEGLAETLSILKFFSKQVIVLKATRTISRQKIDKAGYLKRSINKLETSEFSEFCHRVELARNGHEYFRRQIIQLANDATEEAEKALSGAQAHIEAAQKLFGEFSKEEVVLIRKGGEFSQELFKKIIDHVLQMTIFSHDDLGVDIRRERFESVINSIIFRALLCNYLMALRWHANGSPPKQDEKIRNHVYDCGFAAYATLFEGFLTADSAALNTYRAARSFLNRIEGRQVK